MEFIFEKRFLNDYKRIKIHTPSVAREFDAVLRQIEETGSVPDSYNPHELTNSNCNYTGHMEFHIAEGRLDIIVIYMPHKTNPTIRFVRIGSHQDIFGGPLL